MTISQIFKKIYLHIQPKAFIICYLLVLTRVTHITVFFIKTKVKIKKIYLENKPLYSKIVNKNNPKNKKNYPIFIKKIHNFQYLITWNKDK